MKIAPVSSSSFLSPGIATALVAGALLLAPAFSGAQPSPAAAEQATSQLAEVAVGPAEEDGIYDLLFEPPDGEWLVDESGEEYIISRWPKFDGYYRWVDEENLRVRLGNLMVMQAVDHDDEYLYFRFPRPADSPELVTAGAADPRIEVPLPPELPEVDRLRLERWDAGLPEAGQWRNGFAIADMNGDGHLDLVMPPSRKGLDRPAIFLGDGKGGWTWWSEAQFPDMPYDYGDVAAADLDGDGHQDIVLAMHLMGLVALRGDGAGGFTSWSEGLPMRADARKRRPTEPSSRNHTVVRGSGPSPADAPLELSSRAITLVDWNGSGRPDILALSEGPTGVEVLASSTAPDLGKIVYLNHGDGTWTAVSGPGPQLGDVILTVDLDGDGLLDFVTDSGRVGERFLLNYRDGDSWTLGALPVRKSQLTRAVAVGDLDGDGRPDLAVAYQSSESGEVRYGIDLYFAGPAPAGSEERVGWERQELVAWPVTAGRGVEAMEIADLDGDGRLDLVALPAAGGVWLFLNEGERRFAREGAPEAAPDDSHHYCTGYRARVRDLDGDGRPELVAVFAGEPGSEVMLVGSGIKTRCPARGAVRVWKIVPAPEAAGAEAPASEGLRPSEKPL
ncbi:MAG TPA: VCBS repeat-containing protein [Thermoanaerobaculia bacterium]|nr:VCBS repeat-containing protein [Thermoanaerobaculia bacterium]